MGFVTVNSCCCCDLRAGGLIVGYIGLVIHTLTLMNSFSSHWFFLCVMLTSTASVVAWLYGIYKEDVKAMLPELVLSWILSIALISVLIIILIAAIFGVSLGDWISKANEMNVSRFDETGQRYYIGDNISPFPSLANLARTALGLLWFVIFIPAAIQYYFTAVKHSLYMSMKSAEAESATPAQQTIEMTNINVP